jgi:enoyl-CoA hydratase/carnithine racemase
LPPRFDLAHAPPTVLHTMDKPTICALNGRAAGYGMDLALGCDIRVASDRAKLAAASRSAASCRERRHVAAAAASSAGRRRARSRSRAHDPGAECLELGPREQVVAGTSSSRRSPRVADEIADNAPLACRRSSA